jgi:hypothetical protein
VKNLVSGFEGSVMLRLLKTGKSGICSFLASIILLGGGIAAHAATWTSLTNLPPGAVDTMLLLTDGTVLAHQAGCAPGWFRLSPNNAGNYINGTWSVAAPMGTGRLYFASHVLPNGNVWVLGGEYVPSGTGCSAVFTRTGEIYNTLTNSWSPIANHPDPQFGDDPSMLISTGKILAGSIGTRNTFLYDIATNTWSAAIPKVYNDRSDEETWVMLPGNRVLNYDLFQSFGTGGAYAEVYSAATNSWSSVSPSDGTALGTIPQLSSTALGAELGPALRLHDGRAWIIGATGHTAFYDPATNTWSAGPDVMGTLSGTPSIFGADDAPGAITPNGHVIFLADAGPSQFTSSGNITTGSNIITNIPSTAILQPSWSVRGTGIPNGSFITSVDSPNQVHMSANATATIVNDTILWGGTFSRPTQAFDFNPTTNTISPVAPPFPDLGAPNNPAFIYRMLVLPTGQILVSNSSRTLYVYTPDGLPDPAVRPVINAVTYNGGGVFTLTGKQLNGQSSGSSYGDDAESDENYPIIRLRDALGNVFYARSTNWNNVDVATGTVPESVDFTLKPGMTPGNYSLTVVGAGVASFPAFINITAAEIAGL